MILANPYNDKVLKELKKEKIKVMLSIPFIPRQEAKYTQARRNIMKLISRRKLKEVNLFR